MIKRSQIFDALILALKGINGIGDYTLDINERVFRYRERPFDMNSGEIPCLEVRDPFEERAPEGEGQMLSGPDQIYIKALTVNINIVTSSETQWRALLVDCYTAIGAFYDANKALVDSVEEISNDTTVEQETDKFLGGTLAIRILYRHTKFKAA